MVKAIASAVVLVALSGAAQAAVVYTQTAIAAGFNPGPRPADPTEGIPAGNAQQITFDDVPFPIAETGGLNQLQVTRISYTVRVNPGFGGGTATAYYADTVNGGTDLAAYLGTPVSVGTMNIPVNTGTANANFVISIGDGVTPLFTANLGTDLFGPNFPAFSVGLQFSNSDLRNGRWNVADPAAPGADVNDDTFFWVYDPDFATGIDADGKYAFAFSAPTASRFAMTIEGNFVPTPGAAGLLAAAGLIAARRRRA